MNSPPQGNQQNNGNEPMRGFEQIFSQNPFFQNPEQFMRNAQNNGAHIHTSFSNNTSNNFNVYNNNMNSNHNPNSNQNYNQSYNQNQERHSNYNREENPTDFEKRMENHKYPNLEKEMKRNALKFNRQGNDLYKKKKYRQALECYELGLDIQKHWKLYKNMAWCYKRLGLFKESVKYIKKSILLNDSDDVLYRLGGIFTFSLFSNSEKLNDGKLVQEFFKLAYELEQNDTNYHNYMMARKVMYLFIQKEEKDEKEELINYLLDQEENESQIVSESEEEDEEKERFSEYLKINYYESRPKMPEHIKGKISLEIMKNPILTLSGVSY